MKNNADKLGNRSPSETAIAYGIPAADSSGKLGNDWLNTGSGNGLDADTVDGKNPGSASGLATLDGSSLVVQNPANATATPTASKIPIADTDGELTDWVYGIQPVWNYTVSGSAVQTVTTNGTVTLDGNTHGGYILEATILNSSGGACAYSLYVENDTTATNYYSQRVGAAAANDARLLFDNVSNGYNLVIQGVLTVTGTSYFSYIGMAQRIGDNANDSHSIYKTATITNLTRIDIAASAAAGIGIGSRFRLWRRM